MPKLTVPGIALVLFFLISSPFAQSAPPLSLEDEIRAGDALLVSFQKSQGLADTPDSKAIEQYLQEVGDKVAKNAKRKLAFKFHLDPHPGFRSAVAYPGGNIVVGGGVLALMTHEDELEVVLRHEIEHIDLNQCAQRVISAMQRDHLSAVEFNKLSIDEFGSPYGKDGELAADREGILLPGVVRVGQSAPSDSRVIAQVLERSLNGSEHELVAAAESMPEEKYSFAPRDGEFKGVRTFAEEVKHVATVNFSTWADIRKEKPPVDLGSMNQSLETKAEIVRFLKDSYAYAHKSLAVLKDPELIESIKSPFGSGTITRLGMAIGVFVHAQDHYGQMVEYLRMNRIIPPASR